ncbi:MAG TPA: hypothetical protein VJ865_12375 [Gemmatimonadaceae bacterium]|nr:hypothetical protein [Gemmatimonadaceae bacterium]
MADSVYTVVRPATSSLTGRRQPERTTTSYHGRNPFADSAARQSRHHYWPFYALGGAVLGGGFVAIYGVTHCDLGCRDDGALAYLPAYVGIGAVAGALIGALVGFAVDSR